MDTRYNQCLCQVLSFFLTVGKLTRTRLRHNYLCLHVCTPVLPSLERTAVIVLFSSYCGRVAFMRQAFCLSRLNLHVSFRFPPSPRNNHTIPFLTQCRNQSQSLFPPRTTAAPSVLPSVVPSPPFPLKPHPSAPYSPNPIAKSSSRGAQDQRLCPHHLRSSPMSRVRLLVLVPASSMSTKPQEGVRTRGSG